MQRTRTTNREAAQNNRPSHPPNPSLPRQPLCPGTRLFPCAFSRRSEAQREDNARRDPRHSRGFSVRQESCEGRTASRSAVGTSSAFSTLRPCWMAALSSFLRGQLCISTDSSCIRRDTNDTITRLEVFHRRMRGFDRVFDVAA
jgi:hypothetical protein